MLLRKDAMLESIEKSEDWDRALEYCKKQWERSKKDVPDCETSMRYYAQLWNAADKSTAVVYTSLDGLWFLI